MNILTVELSTFSTCMLLLELLIWSEVRMPICMKRITRTESFTSWSVSCRKLFVGLQI